IGQRSVIGRAGPGDFMTDDDSPDNVIPFPDLVTSAVARGLREYFQKLADEPLPDEIAALAQEFVKLANGGPEPETPTNGGEEKGTEEKSDCVEPRCCERAVFGKLSLTLSPHSSYLANLPRSFRTKRTPAG